MKPNRISSFARFLSRTFAATISLAVLAAFWYWAGNPVLLEEPHPASSGLLQSVSYTPLKGNESPHQFTRGDPVPEKRIREDLAILSRRFSAVRTYSTIRLETLPELAAEYGMKVLLGAWISSDPAFCQRELQEVIQIARRYPEAVSAVIVGNEALLRREVTGDQLAGYIRQVKSALPGIPVTYADVWEFWIKHPEVAPAVDFITIHILPYWEDNPVSIDESLNHIREIRAKMSALFPDKEILIGETGWPSQGRMRRGALPGIENQARFIRGFVSLAEQEGWRYNLIEAFDQPWKRTDEGAVGGFWGLYDANRLDKNVLSGPVFPVPHQWKLFLLSAGITIVCFLVTGAIPGIPFFRLMAFSVLTCAGAVLLALQTHQFTIITRNSGELVWAAIVVGQGFFACLWALRFWAAGSIPNYAGLWETWKLLRNPSHLSFDRRQYLRRPEVFVLSVIRISVLVCALIAATGLLLDSRYRSFPNAGFLVSAFAFAWMSGKNQSTQAGGAMERIIAILLTASGLGIFFHETYHNHQAVIWSVVCVILSFPLWRESRGSPLFRWVAALISLAGAYWFLSTRIREFLHTIGDCAQSPAEGLCLVRTMMGMMMFDQVFGISSLVICALALWINHPAALAVSAAGGMMAIMLYNGDMGIIALVLSTVAWIGAAPDRGQGSPGKY